VPRYGGFYASTTYISLCDVDEAEPDTLSHTCDRVSEAGQMLQGGACAIWHKVTRIGEHYPIKMGSFEVEHPPNAPKLCIQYPPAQPHGSYICDSSD